MKSKLASQHASQHSAQLNELGVLAARAGQHDVALRFFGEALVLLPNDAALKKNLALATYSFGDHLQACELLCELAQEQPEDLDNVLLAASMLQAQRRYRAACSLYECSSSIENWATSESFIRLRIHHAAALRSLGRLEDALKIINEVRLFIEDESAILKIETRLEYYTNLANIHFDLCQWAESVAGYEKALAIDSADAIIHSNLGCALQEFGDYARAIYHHQQALTLEPNSRAVRWNYANTLLLCQQWSAGWHFYEARPAQNVKPPGVLNSITRWSAFDEPSRTVLIIVSEQGIGDFVFFSRFTSVAKARCKQLILFVEPALAELASQLNLQASVCTQANELVAIQAQSADLILRTIPVGSLALAFQDPTLPPPGQTAYLHPSKALVAKFSEKQEKLHGRRSEGYNIGLAWRGSPEHRRDRIRSIELALLMESLPSIAHYVSLYPAVSEGEANLLEQYGVSSYGEEISDIASTAALISTLDLIISVDTSLAHISAAQGRPSWILLPKACDWRWGTDPKKTIWYASARLFRQSRHGDWSNPLNELKTSLERELSSFYPSSH